jgi:hypothetical protein
MYIKTGIIERRSNCVDFEIHELSSYWEKASNRYWQLTPATEMNPSQSSKVSQRLRKKKCLQESILILPVGFSAYGCTFQSQEAELICAFNLGEMKNRAFCFRKY